MNRRLASKIVAAAKRRGFEAEILEIADGTAGGRRTIAVVMPDHAQFTLALIEVTRDYAEYRKVAGAVKAGPVSLGDRERLAIY